jgi:alpha-L-arabinofuranosidase
MDVSELAKKVYDMYNIEFVDIVMPEEVERGNKQPHELFKEWNEWNVAEKEDKIKIISRWILNNITIDILNSDDTDYKSNHIFQYIKENRRKRLYNNIDYVKSVLEGVLHEDDKHIYQDLLDNETNIEIVREELKFMLKQIYDLEVCSGNDPDPLEYEDVVGDIRL